MVSIEVQEVFDKDAEVKRWLTLAAACLVAGKLLVGSARAVKNGRRP